MTNENSHDPHFNQAPDNVEELFLLHVRYKEAQQLISGIHQPILLTNPNTCWLVYAGFVDLFATPLVAGKASGNRIHRRPLLPRAGPVWHLAITRDQSRFCRRGQQPDSLIRTAIRSFAGPRSRRRIPTDYLPDHRSLGSCPV